MATEVIEKGRTVLQERPSVDEWILDSLRERGAQTMDQLSGSMPAVNWAQFFLAIDRLSRTGKITLWPPKNGEYLVSVKRKP
jgi:hypothetical protein